ncbi:proline dehydrogenase family protein [Kineosporia sp. J2-2]|uniref:proline dehydrogenase n=1 Tax=Kineosporia corallincola TaxID=2835133 RepID=A0ABS5T9L1_9ACTN|nr:proline dehydrogenase family protein [Kineosporia corallincola]MBT0767732.1 proline dehydrogenase family protein [Kineosporia corallincola]
MPKLLLAAARTRPVRASVSALPMTHKMVRRFIAGPDAPSALAVTKSLRDQGLAVTLDVLGEDVTDRAQAAATAAAYRSLLGSLSDAGLADRAEVSVKLSALGQALGADGDKIALENAFSVATAAAEAGTTMTLDMEDHTTVDSTLGVLRELREQHPWVGAVLQAALYRTEGDCRDLAGSGSRVRLVKGAYAEPASVAHPRKTDVDAAYRRCMEILFAGQGHPMIATHDMALVADACALGRARGDWELQMLYGIRADEQRLLASAGVDVRVYLPFGTDWYGYYIRRLAERPANMLFLLRHLGS